MTSRVYIFEFENPFIAATEHESIRLLLSQLKAEEKIKDYESMIEIPAEGKVVYKVKVKVDADR